MSDHSYRRFRSVEGEPDPVGRALLRWLAPATALAFTWITLHHYEVSHRDLAALTTYLLLGAALPGMLVWRCLRRRTDVFHLDAGAGFAVGCAIQLAVYLPGRWAGFPEIVVLAPILILAVFATSPGLRRWWRGSPPSSLGGVWLIALVVIVGVALLGLGAFRSEPLGGYGAGYPYVDIPFHMALAGELKHHLPFTTPYVYGVPLQYHWYAHAHVAATSWATGAEIEILVRRIIPISMLIAVVVGTAGLAQSWARRRWTGPVAAAMLIGCTAVALYGWQRSGAAPVLGLAWWASPSQSFGQVMVIPCIALLVDIARRRRMPHRGVWALFVLSVAAVMAAKATMVPLLLAGSCLAFGSWLVLRRKLHLPSLLALLVVAGGLAFSQFVIFGGATQGTSIQPLELVNRLRPFYGFTVEDGTVWAVVATVIALIADLYGYLLLTAGMFAFRRRLFIHPGVAALFGIAIAGSGAALVFVQHGDSQRYFTRSAAAIMVPMAVWGLALLIRNLSWQVRLLLGIALVLGPWTALLISWQTDPRPLAGNNWYALWFTLAPIVVAVAASALVGFVLWLAGRRMGARVPAAALASVMLIGMGTLPMSRELASYSQAVAMNGLDHVVPRTGPTVLPWRGDEAARFLRSNSSPDDLVATNAHCLYPPGARCDARAFWLSGWSERRVLLEGWAYTVRANLAARLEGAVFGPFWDPRLEAHNDGIFLDPNPNTAAILKDRYGVDFLFVDKRFGQVDEERMNAIAERLYDRGEAQVWRLR